MAAFFKDSEYYSRKAKYYEELCKSYDKNFFEAMANAADSAHRRELSKGGGTIHRGYYCPSPIKDRVIGGCKRGRLVSRLPSKADAVYEYFFNESNELTLVNKYAVEQGQMYYTQGELIEKKGSATQSVILEDMLHMPYISGISECGYDNGSISLYEYATIIGQTDCPICAFINSEKYLYDGKRLVTCFMDTYVKATGILESQRYDLIYNGDTPVRYTVRECFDGEYRAADPEQVYELLKR